MNSDLLDEYCKNLFGHTNWSMDADDDGNIIIKFYAKPSEDYNFDDRKTARAQAFASLISRDFLTDEGEQND